MDLYGIDISSYQSGIDLAAVAPDFVIIKATEGCSYINPDCDRAYQQAISNNILRGVYHYATGGWTGKQEADWFLKNVQGYLNDAILVLDWESSAERKGVCYANEFLDRVYSQTGIKPLIYLNRNCINTYNWEPVVDNDYGLWLSTLDGSTPTAYGDFPLVAMVQYEIGIVSGYGAELDKNVFWGDESAWNKYAKKTTKPSTPTYTPGYKYKVGQEVRFSTCYASSEDPISKAIPASRMLYDRGKITAIRKGARNPYLIENGLCWVNDGDIRQVY